MVDPFSVSIDTLSLGIRVAQGVFNYYNAFRLQYSDVNHTLDKTLALLFRLRQLSECLRGQTFRDQHQLAKDIERIVGTCKQGLTELGDELGKLRKEQIGGGLDGVAAAAAAATARPTTLGPGVAYPFRKGTLQRLEDNVDDIMDRLSRALCLLHVQPTQFGRTRDPMKDANALLGLVRAGQVESAVHEWLKAPDATIDLNDKCAEKHPGTGLWLTKGVRFREWLEKPESFLWLVGLTGCGKSVLCSAAIQHVLQHRQSNPQIGVACFFFTFSDGDKQTTSSMLRALVLQLSGQIQGRDDDPLTRLYTKCRTSSPADEALLDCLLKLVGLFQHVYILVDALDESPCGRARSNVLQTLRDIRGWSEPGLHMLVTSRDEVDIRDELDGFAKEMPMQMDAIDKDIKRYVCQHLRQDRRLRKWEEHFSRIEQELSQRAQGSFRWVECQFTAIARCPVSERLLDKVLTSVPETLEATYERMLLNIPRPSHDDARRLLLLLCCAREPLTVEEAIDGIAVELEPEPRYDPERKLKNAAALRELCPGLTTVGPVEKGARATVRMAHPSVREYLESDRIRTQPAAAPFAMMARQEDAHAEMARVCMAILLDPVPTGLVDYLKRHRMAHYAATHWAEHARLQQGGGGDHAPGAWSAQNSQALSALRTATKERYLEVRGREWDVRRGPPPLTLPQLFEVGRFFEQCLKLLQGYGDNNNM